MAATVVDVVVDAALEAHGAAEGGSGETAVVDVAVDPTFAISELLDGGLLLERDGVAVVGVGR